ncbi:MAG: hypothetical protein ACE1Z8_10345, partial [Candidatus Acidiferrales bacterium]
VFAANYLWPQRGRVREQLVLVLRLVEAGKEFTDALRADLVARNRRLLDFKRVGGYVIWERDFPRTASLKIKRNLLAEEIRDRLDRTAVVPL